MLEHLLKSVCFRVYGFLEITHTVTTVQFFGFLLTFGINCCHPACGPLHLLVELHIGRKKLGYYRVQVRLFILPKLQHQLSNLTV